MAYPNIFGNVEAFSGIFQPEDLLEGRFENDVNGNPIYVGYSIVPNANPALAIWYIQKIEYDGESIVRKRLPDSGTGLIYVWNNRATYFS